MNCDLREAKFKDSSLSESIFENTNLSKADFSEAMDYVISPERNKIKKAKFSMPEVLGLLKDFDITIK
ncbi:MAG: pentapeptide repeat-containing protein [Clostridium sp.]